MSRLLVGGSSIVNIVGWTVTVSRYHFNGATRILWKTRSNTRKRSDICSSNLLISIDDRFIVYYTSKICPLIMYRWGDEKFEKILHDISFRRNKCSNFIISSLHKFHKKDVQIFNINIYSEYRRNYISEVTFWLISISQFIVEL